MKKGKIILDTNVFYEFYDGKELEGISGNQEIDREKLNKYLQEAAKEKRIVIHEVVFREIMIRLYYKENKDKILDVIQFIIENDIEVLTQESYICGEYKKIRKAFIEKDEKKIEDIIENEVLPNRVQIELDYIYYFIMSMCNVYGFSETLLKLPEPYIINYAETFAKVVNDLKELFIKETKQEIIEAYEQQNEKNCFLEKTFQQSTWLLIYTTQIVDILDLLYKGKKEEDVTRADIESTNKMLQRIKEYENRSNQNANKMLQFQKCIRWKNQQYEKNMQEEIKRARQQGKEIEHDILNPIKETIKTMENFEKKGYNQYQIALMQKIFEEQFTQNRYIRKNDIDDVLTLTGLDGNLNKMLTFDQKIQEVLDEDNKNFIDSFKKEKSLEG